MREGMHPACFYAMIDHGIHMRQEEKDGINMANIITYVVGHHLYLNITNRCTNRCAFCIRDKDAGIGHDLWLDHEPSAEEIIAAIGMAEGYHEVVFCGYGEPLMRLPEVVAVSAYLKSIGKKVRVNTNGQADLFWGHSVASELKGLVDAISISLNAQSAVEYQNLCQSDYGEEAFDAVLKFAASCVPVIPEVILSVVDVISEEAIAQCRKLAEAAGTTFRVRHLLGK
jgi:TatD family-associated radical SAM protein